MFCLDYVFKKVYKISIFENILFNVSRYFLFNRIQYCLVILGHVYLHHPVAQPIKSIFSPFLQNPPMNIYDRFTESDRSTTFNPDFP